MSSWKERQSTKSYCKAISKLAINIFRSLVFSLVLFHIPWSFRSILDHEIQPTNRSFHRSYVIQIFVRAKHVAVAAIVFQPSSGRLRNLYKMFIRYALRAWECSPRASIGRQSSARSAIENSFQSFETYRNLDCKPGNVNLPILWSVSRHSNPEEMARGRKRRCWTRFFMYIHRFVRKYVTTSD